LDKEKALISVIIPTLNSENYLEKCLVSLKNQTYNNIEVFIVDDGSSDSTLEIAQRYECKILRNISRGRTEAKNRGSYEANGIFYFFVDSDMELSSEVISECVNLSMSDPKIGGIVIPESSVGDSFWVKVRDFERSFYSGTLVESARFFVADLVKKVGGFEEGIIFFEESTLPYKIQRLGFNIHKRAKSEIFHHEENFSLGSWLKKKAFYGKTLGEYTRRYRYYSSKQLGIVYRLFLFTKEGRRFLSRPELAIATLLLKSLESFAVGLGYAYSNIERIWQ
jgi:glycosyltransferase involved in cell wall biosynthesis